MSLDNLHNEKRCAIKHLKGFQSWLLPSIYSINFNCTQLTQYHSMLSNF